MKRFCAAAAFLLLLTGCAQTEIPDVPETPDPAAETTAPTETAAPDTQSEQPTQAVSPDVDETAKARALYVKTLTDLHDQKLLPNGNPLTVVGDLEANRFAVCDIDGDEREELLLEITQADVNDAFTAVYDMDSAGDLRREVRYAAQVSFWSDGIVIAEYPDAAESEQDFIPYAAAQYDADQDVYTEFAYVSAIDRDKLAANGLLDEYPEDADTSGTGRVYCIRGDNPVDVTEYEAWYASWHTELTAQDVPYQALTAENIEKLTQEGS